MWRNRGASIPDDMIRVLVVEDDPADARLVTEAFRNARGVLCVPNHVTTLAAAVEWVREAPCDVVLLDLSLPDSRGVETLQGMLRVAGDAPVIVLSGFDDPEFAAMAVEIGAQDYLVKGTFDGDTLARTLRHALARKELEEHARLAGLRVQNIIESAHDAIVTVAADQTIVMVNPAAERLFGWPAELLIGRDLDVLIPPPDRPGHHERVMDLAETGKGSTQIAQGRELTGLHRDGSEVAVEITVSPTPAPQGMLFTAFIRDVTERRSVSRALRVAKEAAENALMELGRAQARLVQAEKLSSLGQLVAGLSHEINTPIGTALTGTSILETAAFDLRRKLENPATFRRSDLAEYMETADESVRIVMTALQRAAGLVRQFKQAATEQNGEARRCRFSLRHLLADFAAAAVGTLAEKNCVLNIECPEDIEMDSHPIALSQVLSQLTLNAAQHAYPPAAPGQTPRSVRLRAERHGEKDCRLELSDHGVGVPEADRHRVFEPFFTTGRGAGHSGLGLHIAFNLVTGALGGFIALDEAQPTGTRVVIDLPLTAPS
jgi:PAS domain S-box-containing protein